MAVSKLLANTKKVPSGPEAAFCKILSTLYATHSALLDIPLRIPLAYVKRVKGQIKRMEKIVAKKIDLEIKYLEKVVIDLYLLDSFNKNKKRSNFCAIAYNCSALVNALAESPIVPVDQQEAVKTNYALFESIICKQGLSRIISNWVDEKIAEVIAAIAALRDKLLTQLGIDAYISAYNTLISTNIPNIGAGYEYLVNMTTTQWLNVLDGFVDCVFVGCDYAETAANLKEDWIEKLALDDENFTGLIGNVTSLNDAFDARLDDLEEALKFRDEELNINVENIMKN